MIGRVTVESWSVHAEAGVSTWLLDAATLLVALQATDVAVVGQVRDAESGEAVAGVVITFTDIARSTISDSLGRYVLRSIPPGPHHLTVRRIGYSARALHALVPRTGELRLDITLRRDPLRLPSIAVRPSVIVRGSTEEHASNGDRSASLAAIRNHPLLAEPDAFMALGGGSVVLHSESPSGVHIGGGCYCLSGGNDDCSVCDPPCTGGQVCREAFNPAGGAAICGCTTPPICPTTNGPANGEPCTMGNCPAGASCFAHPAFCGCRY